MAKISRRDTEMRPEHFQIAEMIFALMQLALLAINAWLLWKYVLSTQQIEHAATEQAKMAARQAEISAQQAEFAADQVEGASRPVLALHNATALNLELANVGTGPALNIQWWIWPEDQEGPGSLEAPAGRLGFIAAGTSRELPYSPMVLRNPPRKILCRYESVGGVIYRSEGFLKSDSMKGVWYELKCYAEALIEESHKP